MFSATLNGLEEALQELEDETLSGLPAIVETWAQGAAQHARAEHPYTDRTGNLTASIEALPARTVGGRVEGGVVAGMDYASYVDEGTSRARPYPYLQPAAQATESYAEEIAERGLRAAVTRADGWRAG